MAITVQFPSSSQPLDSVSPVKGDPKVPSPLRSDQMYGSKTRNQFNEKLIDIHPVLLHQR